MHTFDIFFYLTWRCKKCSYNFRKNSSKLWSILPWHTATSLYSFTNFRINRLTLFDLMDKQTHTPTNKPNNPSQRWQVLKNINKICSEICFKISYKFLVKIHEIILCDASWSNYPPTNLSFPAKATLIRSID